MKVFMLNKLLRLIILLILPMSNLSGAEMERLTRSQDSERILNGEEVDGVNRQVPWIFSLRRDGKHLCAASFIHPKLDGQKISGWSADTRSPRWALTAAHCVVDGDGNKIAADRLAVWGGNLDISVDTTTATVPGEIQSVQSIFLPGNEVDTGIEAFNPRTLENDIALLLLDDSNENLQGRRISIRFPDLREVGWVYEPYTAVYTAGWGRTEALLASKKLREVRLPLVEKERCQEKYDHFGDRIAPGMICAGYVSGEYDACQGDSGGPLYYRPSRSHGRTSSPLLVGVVSWGRNCGSSDLFGVYSSVTFFERWVRSVITAHN